MGVLAVGVNYTSKVFEAREIALPEPKRGEVVVEPIHVGLCGTDLALLSGLHGHPEAGTDFMVTGHESVVKVTDPENSGLKPGYYGVRVRQSRPHLHGEQHVLSQRPDMGHNPGEWLEAGIFGLNGSNAQKRVFSAASLVELPEHIPPHYFCLAEPLSCIVKVINRMEAFRYSADFPELKSHNEQLSVAVVGAGPIGLLAGLAFRYKESNPGLQMGTKHHTLTYLDILTDDSLKAGLVRALGGEYVRVTDEPMGDFLKKVARDRGNEAWGGFNYVLEASGNVEMALRCCLLGGSTAYLGKLGIPHSESTPEVPDLRELQVHEVLQNIVSVGSVNAGEADWPYAVSIVAWAFENQRAFLDSIITARIDGLSVDAITDALHDRGNIKTIVDVQGS